MNETRVVVMHSPHPTYKSRPWLVISEHTATDWERSQTAAIKNAIARLGGPGIPHTIRNDNVKTVIEVTR